MSLIRIEVREVQRGLKNAGHDPGRIDGIWGERTRAAAVAWLAPYLASDDWDTPGTIADAVATEIERCEAGLSRWQACDNTADLGWVLNWGRWPDGTRSIQLPQLMASELRRLAVNAPVTPPPMPTTETTPAPLVVASSTGGGGMKVLLGVAVLGGLWWAWSRSRQLR